MKNKIIVKSQNILSFDHQVKEHKPKLIIDSFIKEYFKGKITPPLYLYLIKQYKE